MGQLEVGFVDLQVIIEEEVDVDGAVGVMLVNALMLAAELALYFLCFNQALVWGERSLNLDAAVQELVVRLKAPRFGFDERRTRHHAADPLADKHDGAFHRLLPLAEVGTQAEVEGM